MSSTARLALPLVSGGQSQKHVTVNTAFERLDAVSQLTLISVGVETPPVSATDGDVYGIGSAPVNAWAQQGGNIATSVNGGWEFLTPQDGWRAWIADEGVSAAYLDGDWVVGGLATSASGAMFQQRVIEVDHVVSAGPTSQTAQIIPAGAIVFGITGRVLADMGDTASTWKLGIDGVSDDRYGSGIGTSSGAWLRGITSSPLAYYANTALTLTAEGGDFGNGSVRLAVHVTELSLPSA